MTSILNKNMFLFPLFADSRGANTGLGRKKNGWCTAVSNELLILLLLTPWGVRNPGPATCAFGYSKKILERNLPEQSKSSEEHFIFLSQMGKWEFREGWRHYILMNPMVACRDIPTLIKCKFYATRGHKHLNQDPTWYVQKGPLILCWRMAYEERLISLSSDLDELMPFSLGRKS